jgi:hypothetical protein
VLETNTAVWFKQICKKKKQIPDSLNGKAVGNDCTVNKTKDIRIASVVTG